ncbi:hypothetical protein BFS06_12380 [Clostridium perfringens]|uniref:Uncharacterized protein n=1 Tax=Clostridium perfringens TaxID=1502 RepID=A0A140GR43_CLOPF|nr:hypothetical protein [Clostridium perfringens]AMN31002.1 hypothetical protein JFP838_pA0086 [Clostridium perfringens]TBX14998.1 hypothetical protein BFS06_12380 [Clostridium perfringens]
MAISNIVALLDKDNILKCYIIRKTHSNKLNLVNIEDDFDILCEVDSQLELLDYLKNLVDSEAFTSFSSYTPNQKIMSPDFNYEEYLKSIIEFEKEYANNNRNI